MSVYLYPGGFRLVRKSGVGQALLHQQKALISAGIPLAQTIQESSIVHINTVFPDSFLIAFTARISGKKSFTMPTQRWKISAILSRVPTSLLRYSKYGSNGVIKWGILS